MLWHVLRSPYLLIALAPLCWSGNWLLARAMHTEVTPISLNFSRWLVALAVLLPLTFPRLWARRAVIRREWRILAVLGFLGITLFNTLVYLALQSTTAINAALVNSVIPVAIVAISWLVYRETVAPLQALGIALSLAGVLAIVSRGQPARLLDLRVNPGDLWALASVPVWGLYTVLLRRRPHDLEPMVLLAAITAIGVGLLLPLALWDVAAGGGLRLTGATLVTVLYLGLFASVIAVALWNVGVAAIGANRSGVFLHLLPAFTTIEAIVFLGESLHAYHGLGVALIVAGIYFTTTIRPATPAPAGAR